MNILYEIKESSGNGEIREGKTALALRQKNAASLFPDKGSKEREGN